MTRDSLVEMSTSGGNKGSSKSLTLVCISAAHRDYFFFSTKLIHLSLGAVRVSFVSGQGEGYDQKPVNDPNFGVLPR